MGSASNANRTGALCGVLIVDYGYMSEIRRGVVDAHPRLELRGIRDLHRRPTDLASGCRHFTDHCGRIVAAKR